MRKRVSDRLNNIRLGNKIILSYVILMLLPFLILGVIVVGEMRKSTMNSILDQLTAAAGRIKERSSELLVPAMELSDRATIDSNLQNLVSKHYESTWDVVKAYEAFATFHIFLDFNRSVTAAKIYVDNPTLLDNWEFRPLDKANAETDWYRLAAQNSGLIGWLVFDDASRKPGSVMSLVRSMRVGTLTQPACLVLDINTDLLSSTLRQESFDSFIIDDNDYVAASKSPDRLGKKLSIPGLESIIATKKTGSFDVSLNGSPYRVLIDEIRPERCFSALRIGIVYSIDDVMAESNRISVMGLVILIACFVFTLAFLSFIYSTLANRLLSLSKHIDLVSVGRLDVVIPVDGQDEIGHIARQLNGMVANIGRLMDEVQFSNEQKSRLELRQREMQFKMLASQINPHFLYNALESIRMKAHLRGEKEIAQTVKLLGKLMRKNLEAGSDPIPLSAEIENTRNYLEIEKFRLEDHISFGFEIDAEAEGLMVPPLIIEPLVENAVVHGIEKRHQGGSVVVSARIKGASVEIEVGDNGRGMSREKLEEVRSSLGSAIGHHIGLSNVHQRLVLLYGPQCGLEIESAPESGTRIRFTLPREVRDA